MWTIIHLSYLISVWLYVVCALLDGTVVLVLFLLVFYFNMICRLARNIESDGGCKVGTPHTTYSFDYFIFRYFFWVSFYFKYATSENMVNRFFISFYRYYYY